MTENQEGSKGEPKTPLRRVKPGQTLREALLDEMARRGHNQNDAAKEMRSTEANVSRWLNKSAPMPDDMGAPENIGRLVRYLRLRTEDDYAILAFNMKKWVARRRD